MPVFTYTGRGTRGVINGEIEASDRTSAVGELRNRAILVTKIAEKAGGKLGAPKLGGKVSDKELAIFTRQFSTMVDAGLPLVQCLNILAEQSESKTLRGVTANVARQVEAGSTVAIPAPSTTSSPTSSRSVRRAVSSTSSSSACPSTSRRRPPSSARSRRR
jgi:type IV pilus assembly protein PilC